MFDFGLRLQQLRVGKKLSQSALAKKINRSKSLICGYENNVVVPPLDILVQLAMIFNVSLDYLVGIDKNDMVSVEGLDERQRELVRALVSSLGAPARYYPSLTDAQQDVLNNLMIEFAKKNK